MTENSTAGNSAFGLKFGEWEPAGDRIRRRRVSMGRMPADRWQYEISREFEGEIFTGTLIVYDLILSELSTEQFETHIREEFFYGLGKSDRERGGAWFS